jgi:hypothetical protein
MQLANNGQPLKLTWEAVVQQFQNLVKHAAKQQVVNYGIDNMMSPEDLYQEGMIKLYDCWEIWCIGENKDMDEFGPIFRKSLYRCVQQKGSVNNKHSFVDIEDSVNTLKADEEDTVERMYREEGLQKLLNSLSDIAKQLLAELIEPSPLTLFHVWADIERKKMLKSQGKKVNIPKDNTVRMKHIIRSLGITQKQYDVAMLEIRENANLLLER